MPWRSACLEARSSSFGTGARAKCVAVDELLSTAPGALSVTPPYAQVFNVRTLLVKFFSCAAAVGSGLPVGPEGPMVHIGAMAGAALSQGHSTTLGFSTGLFQRFQNPKDKRDFVTAGADRAVAPRHRDGCHVAQFVASVRCSPTRGRQAWVRALNCSF